MIITKEDICLRLKRFVVCCCLIILTFTQSTVVASGYIIPDNFKELSLIELNNVDYKIETDLTDSNVLVMAIHGGKIEKGTTKLAYALSSHNNYNYYSFLGLKSKGNSVLHIPSEKFDEPTALEMVSKSETTISIHGCSGSKEFTYMGGLDTDLANRIKKSLIKYGFTVLDTPKNLAGISPDNIVNKNMDGRGVQLEISKGLRTRFLSSNNDSLENYVFAISEAVKNSQ